jgi:hypothetical protein
VSKQQILALLADATRRDGFALDAFHDRLWRGGNIPLGCRGNCSACATTSTAPIASPTSSPKECRGELP